MDEMGPGGGIGDLAVHLHDHPTNGDFQAAPVTLYEYSGGVPVTRRRSMTREVLDGAIKRIGPPTLCGGDATGPVVRWRDDQRTLLLDHGQQALRLCVRRTSELEAEERARFAPCQQSDPVGFYTGLPYVWQLYGGGVGSPPLGFPAVPPAPDWSWLEGSLAQLLSGWWEQVPVQLGYGDAVGFNIDFRGEDQHSVERVSVMCEEPGGLVLLVDDRAVPGGTPEDVMRARGWRQRIMGWWQRDFEDDGADGAARAAKMVVEELLLRGARSPDALKVTDVRAERGGLLALPGLAIAR
ncbi:hypothetical protein SAZ_33075 [Streptomyces noursei ZPM]|nr:hypothetical protein SAZ_33075 [Streptomyces noursei ZPM]EXU92600.1 hypothetical protein P354_15640 [Streptomyces noursei PD-1]